MNEYIVRFYNGSTKKAKVAKSLLQYASSYSIEKNILLDDSTENYVVKYYDDNLDRLEQMLVCLSATKLRKGQEINYTPCSYAIFDVSIGEITRQINNKYGVYFMMENERACNELCAQIGKNIPYEKYLDYCKRFREVHLSASIGSFRRTKGKEEFKHEVQLVNKIIQRLISELSLNNIFDVFFFLQEEKTKMVNEYKSTYSATKFTPYKMKKYKKEVDQTYMKLIADGSVESAFLSEAKMFEIIQKKYKNAIPQYSPPFLGRQRYDVYIPKLNVAIEYQGEQHYKPIEFFGGKEGYEKRKELDKRKYELSIENNVKLIYWEYYEPINEILLDIKLSSIHY